MNEILIVSLYIFFNVGRGIEIWETINLGAVTHFEGIEEYYRNLRQQRTESPPTEPYEEERRASIKRKICEHVMTSHFFKMHRIRWVNLDLEWVQEQLRTNHRGLFFSIFDEYEYESRYCAPLSGYGYEYQNRYKIRRVRIGHKEEDEYTFRCVAKNLISAKIEEYFVTRPYNVNAIDSSYPIAGRFVLTQDEENDEILKIVAMAEAHAIESAGLILNKIAGIHYELNRSSLTERIAATPQMDPVCSLRPAQKLRMCSSIFGMHAFKQKFRFLPILDSVHLECEKRIVFIGFFPEDIFEEWVIGCIALTLTNEPITFYVSRGYEVNSIYVFKTRLTDAELIFPCSVCNNVSVVGVLVRGANINTNALNQINRGEHFLQEDVED